MSDERAAPDGKAAAREDRPSGSGEDSELLERIRGLEEEIGRLRERNKDLEEENEIFRDALRTKGIDIENLLAANKELRFRVSMNSSNSSKPPSTDGYAKPKPRSLRAKTGRKPGGQPGHAGHNMTIPHEPDLFEEHLPARCGGCPRKDGCKADGMLSCSDRRYVVDVVTTTVVTEHSLFEARCPMGDAGESVIRGRFPDGVSAHVQYGSGTRAIVSVLDTNGAMSDSRISTLMRDLFGITLSPGTVVSMTSECADAVRGTVEKVRREIAGSPVGNFDETGARVNGALRWIHVSSTPTCTHLTISEKRGKEGIDRNGVLPGFTGRAVHDCFTAYDGYTDATHAVCCAHLLRETIGIEELEPDHAWASAMKCLLLDMKSARDDAFDRGRSSLDRAAVRRFESIYDRVLELADTECPPPPPPEVRRRGRPKKGRERSLIERLSRRKDQVCRFIHDFAVPFDNNLAERDLRNIKTKLKVSGCFRSMDHAQDYLATTSYLSTAGKRGIGAVKALRLAFDGSPDTILGRDGIDPALASCD